MTEPAYARFAAQAAQAPGIACLQDDRGVLDRAAVLSDVTRIAASLAGHRPGDQIVGVYLERDRLLAAAMLAVEATGAAVLPLDPAHPPDRLRAILLDSGARILLTTRELADAVRTGPWQVVDAARCRPASPDWRPGPLAAGDRIAYLLYTSGSTGQPKGVAVGHYAVEHFRACVDADLAAFSEGGVWQGVSGVGFDPVILDFSWALSRGKFLVVGPSDPMRLFDSPLARGSAAGPVNQMVTTPSTTRLLSFDPDALAGLRRAQVVFIGGEPFPSELVGLLRPDGAGPALINVYGPTETTVWVTRCAVTAETCTPVSIGEPLPDVTVRILTPDLQPVPAGTPGRLYVAGPCVSFGYWRKGGLTAAAYLPDPFAGSGSRIYDTGDIAVLDPTAGLRLLGRSDQQVKIRGNRVELPEIEHMLLTAPKVREAACVMRQSEGLVAYVAVAEGSEPDLRPWLADRLPAYMLPNRLVVMDRLPRLPSGKLDRAALAALESSGTEISGGNRASG